MTDAQLIKKLTELRSLSGETEVVEFKEAKNDYDFSKLGKYFSALCNEANLKEKEFAWMVFGVENSNRNIVGTHYRKNNRLYLDNLKSEIGNKTTNRITLTEIYELYFPEGRVVMFQIPAAPHGIPVAWEGHYYGRDGEVLVPLNLSELESIRKQASRIDWSAGICDGATVDDLDPAAIALAKINFKIKHPRLAAEVDGWNKATFLNKAKICISGQITRAAILLLGKTESEHFISPAVAGITWVLRDNEKIERDYAHFSCPFISAVDGVYGKIRNLKYRYIKDGTLFPDEVDQYDPFCIKEALSNCIAHQDYSLCGRINLVEREDGYLIFTNLGEFLPGSIETVIQSDSPPEYYRNQFLVKAMENLNMIDTVGSGIKRIFRSQMQRFFPMPDYDFSGNKVKAVITGKVLDIEYARVLARHPNLNLNEIMALDKVQKKIELTDEEIRNLKGRKLIEGRKPNFIISEQVALKTKQVGSYLKTKGFDNDYYKKLVFEFIKKSSNGVSKNEIRDLLLNKLPEILTAKQKETKLSSILTDLKRNRQIENTGSDKSSNWKPVNRSF